METNLLYYGDNLDILRRCIPDGSVDLIYLDPPFNSNRDYNGPNGEMGQALVSVKSGHVNSAMVRDLKGTIEREKAEIGIFVALEDPTKEMELEATTAGLYTSPISGRDYPRIQIVTIRQLLEEGRKPRLPLLLLPTYQQAERIDLPRAAEQQEIFGS